MTRAGIDRADAQLFAYSGKRYVVLATTANINNPDFYIGGVRMGAGAVAANFIFGTPEWLPEVIARFDGRIDAFLLDTEIKNKFNDLPARAENLIKTTPVVRVKPNDMTITALDIWLSILFPDMKQAKILIVGAGNIGAKIALALAERGAEVRLWGRDPNKLKRMAEGLSEVCRGHGKIIIADGERPALDADLILGCTPGVPAISRTMLEEACGDVVVVDVGNGTIFPEAIHRAGELGIRLFCLSPEAGFIGWVTAYNHATQQFSRMKRRKLDNGVSVVGPGILGYHGEVLVDNPYDWRSIIGVCDGRGDFLSDDDAAPFIRRLE